MADSLNAATKYVATHRPEGLGWGPVEDLGPDIVVISTYRPSGPLRTGSFDDAAA